MRAAHREQSEIRVAHEMLADRALLLEQVEGGIPITSLRLAPKFQSALAGNVPKIVVGREHGQVMTKAKLRQQRIDGSNLQARAPTAVSELRGPNVIVAIRHDERHGGKPIQNLCAGFRTREALQQLLQDKAGRQDRLAGIKGAKQRLHLGRWSGRIAPERQRPDAGIDEEAQSRARSAL
jgi:hypothetical protein